MTRIENAARLRQRLLDAAQAEFTTHGYDGATTRGIARAAGASTGAIFNHFPKGKPDLFKAVHGYAWSDCLAGAQFLNDIAPGLLTKLAQLSDGHLADLERVVDAILKPAAAALQAVA